MTVNVRNPRTVLVQYLTITAYRRSRLPRLVSVPERTLGTKKNTNLPETRELVAASESRID